MEIKLTLCSVCTGLVSDLNSAWHCNKCCLTDIKLFSCWVWTEAAWVKTRNLKHQTTRDVYIYCNWSSNVMYSPVMNCWPAHDEKAWLCIISWNLLQIPTIQQKDEESQVMDGPHQRRLVLLHFHRISSCVKRSTFWQRVSQVSWLH